MSREFRASKKIDRILLCLINTLSAQIDCELMIELCSMLFDIKGNGMGK